MPPAVDHLLSSDEDKRIRWLCRRGMKELDVLLERFYDAEFAVLDAAGRDAFRHLLELEDPDLYDLVIAGRQPADPAQARLAVCLRAYRHPT